MEEQDRPTAVMRMCRRKGNTTPPETTQAVLLPSAGERSDHELALALAMRSIPCEHHLWALKPDGVPLVQRRIDSLASKPARSYRFEFRGSTTASYSSEVADRCPP